MYIRPIPYFPLPSGAPGHNCLVYIGLPDTDPKLEANKLDITDGPGGAAVGNPFKINSQGQARNTNGQVVSPYIAENEYSIEYRSQNGALIGRIDRMRSDALSASTGAGAPTVDAVLNNFTAALTADLTGSDLIFIQAYYSGWEAAAAGPRGAFYAYRTGTTGGTPSTGHPGTFYDATGAQFKPCSFQRLYAEMFGAKDDGTTDAYTALNNLFSTAMSVQRPAYLDGDVYVVDDTSATAAANYSSITEYLFLINSDLTIIGGGNTVLRNKDQNSNAIIFLVENTDYFKIQNIVLDGNANLDNNNQSGVLYLAGVNNAQIDATIYRSGALFLAGSTTRQGDYACINATFRDCKSRLVSISACGFKRVDITQLSFDGCRHGVLVDIDDVDAHGYALELPIVNISNVTGEVIDHVFSIYNGAVNIDNVMASSSDAAGKCFIVSPKVNPVYIYANNIQYSGGYFFDCTSSSGGYKIENAKFSNINATTPTNSFRIKSASQLFTEFNIDNLTTTGGIDLQDSTGNGKFKIYDSVIVDSVGITISTAGPKMEVVGVDLSGCATEVSGLDNALWRAWDCDGFTVRTVTQTYTGVIPANQEDTCESRGLTYCRESDEILAVQKSYVAFSHATAASNVIHHRYLTWKQNDQVFLSIRSGSDPAGGGVGRAAIPDVFTTSITKREW